MGELVLGGNFHPINGSAYYRPIDQLAPMLFNMLGTTTCIYAEREADCILLW
jgi:hypothetical protein